MAHAEYTAELNEIVATLVPEQKRMDALPLHFGVRYMLVAENAVYDWMSRLVSSYTGALWQYYELSNGGFYMAPSGDEQYQVVVATNWYEGTMSAEATGITVCLFAFEWLAHRTAQAHFIDLRDKLRDYACRHFEARAIFQAID